MLEIVSILVYKIRYNHTQKLLKHNNIGETNKYIYWNKYKDMLLKSKIDIFCHQKVFFWWEQNVIFLLYQSPNLPQQYHLSSLYFHSSWSCVEWRSGDVWQMIDDMSLVTRNMWPTTWEQFDFFYSLLSLLKWAHVERFSNSCLQIFSVLQFFLRKKFLQSIWNVSMYEDDTSHNVILN